MAEEVRDGKKTKSVSCSQSSSSGISERAVVEQEQKEGRKMSSAVVLWCAHTAVELRWHALAFAHLGLVTAAKAM